MLSGSLEQLIPIADQLDLFFYIKDKDDNFVYVNPFTLKLIDMTLEEINHRDRITFPFEPLFHNDTPLISEDFGVMRVYYLEERDLLKSQPCYFLGKISLNKQYLVVAGHEISEELTGVESIDFYRLLLNSMTDSVAITEPTEPFRILFVNQSFLDLTGYQRFDEVVGKTHEELVGRDPEDNSIREKIKDSVSQNKPISAVLTNYKRGKLEHPYRVRSRIMPLLDQVSGNPKYFLCVQFDVTEEENLKESDLVKSDKLKAVFNTTSNYLWLLDSKGHVLEMNRSARVQGKYVEREFYEGMNFAKGRWWKGNLEVADLIDDVLTKVIRKGLDVVFEAKFLNSLDQISIVSVEMKGNRNAAGDLSYIVVEAHDITDLQNQRNRAVDLVKTETSLNPKEVDAFVADSSGNYKFEKEDLVRITQTEIVLNQQVLPALHDLKEEFESVVKDPEKGLIAKTNSNGEKLNSIDKKIEGLNELNDIAQMFVKSSKWIQKPVIKWFLAFLLGGIGISSIGTWVDKFEQIRDVFVEEEEEISPESTPEANRP